MSIFYKCNCEYIIQQIEGKQQEIEKRLDTLTEHCEDLQAQLNKIMPDEIPQ